LNALPEVKRFLKEPGGLDLYTSLQVYWKPGHDPELEVRNCTGRSPRDDPDGPVVRYVDLSPFTTEELHWLVQCLGMEPEAGQESVPVAASKEACKRLEERLDEGSWTRRIAFGAGAVIMLFIVTAVARWALGPALARQLCPSAARSAKLKREDLEESKYPAPSGIGRSRGKEDLGGAVSGAVEGMP